MGTLGSEVINLGGDFVLRADQIGSSAGVCIWHYDGSTYTRVDSGTFIEGNGWTHIAASFDDSTGTASIYIDGVLAGTQSGLSSIGYSGVTVTRIGAHSSANYDFGGRIDDARIYDRALSTEEIAALSADNTTSSDSVAITVQALNNAPYFTSLPSAEPETVASLAGATSITSADFDNDGDIDLVATNNSGELRWYENDGTGNFASGVLIASAQDFSAVATYDLEGDGDMDIVAMNDDPSDTGDSVYVLTNNFIGSGSVSFNTTSFEGPGGGESDGGQDLAIGDIDGDGRADIAGIFYRSIGDSQVVVFEQNAVGVWTKTYSDAISNGHGIELVDLDGDTDLDIVTGDFPDSRNQLVRERRKRNRGIQQATDSRRRHVADFRHDRRRL